MKNQNYLTQLDGLRAIAVCSVIFGHFLEFKTGYTMTGKFLGASGVNLFFVLSGFLISLILIKTKVKTDASNGAILGKFYLRRFLRIFPLYYFVIIIGLILNIPGAREFIFWLVSYLVNIKFMFVKGAVGAYSHLWSLSVEEQFYILFPILLLITPIKRLNILACTLIAIGLISRVLSLFVTDLQPIAYLFSYSFLTCCLDSFAFGVLLANLFYFKKDFLSAIVKRYYLAALLLLISCYIIFINLELENAASLIFFRAFEAAAFFFIIAKGALTNYTGLFQKFLENKIVVYLGKISYGMYVYHYMVITLLLRIPIMDHYTIKGRSFFLLVITLATIAIASLSFYLFEKPINSLKKYFEYNKDESSA